MFGKPELMFIVTLRKGNVPANHGIIISEKHTLKMSLMFLSAFEKAILDNSGALHRIGDTILLYEPEPLPSLGP